MCGRYSFDNIEKLLKDYGDVKGSGLKPSYNVAPSQEMPVVAVRSPARVYLMRWGLIPFWSKDPKIAYSMINARCEGIEAKPSFRKPIRTQRCLIPASGFYEWKRLKLEKKEEKIPWYIKVKDRTLFYMAGVYDIWKDPKDSEVLSYSIITTTPNDFMSNIHDRMPVILDEKEQLKYLNPLTPLDEVLKMLKPYPNAKMEGWPVSKEVNSPRNNYPGLINNV